MNKGYYDPNKTYYDAGLGTALLEQVSARKFRVVIIYEGKRIEKMFTKKVDALEEILSYAEVFPDWFVKKEKEATA